MEEKSDLIELKGKTVFLHNLLQNKEKAELYEKAVLTGKITGFDQTTITKLRRLYFGFLSGLIYLYYEQTDFSNIGNKLELLTYTMDDKKYNIVHGDTDSTRDILFFEYGVNHLDYNSWIEVEEGCKTWVYDLFSMLKIEKDVYYQLERPKIRKVISKADIVNHPGYAPWDRRYHDGFDFMLIEMIPNMEKNLPNHPFKNILSTEITSFKGKFNFDELVIKYKTK